MSTLLHDMHNRKRSFSFWIEAGVDCVNKSTALKAVKTITDSSMREEPASNCLFSRWIHILPMRSSCRAFTSFPASLRSFSILVAFGPIFVSFRLVVYTQVSHLSFCGYVC